MYRYLGEAGSCADDRTRTVERKQSRLATAAPSTKLSAEEDVESDVPFQLRGLGEPIEKSAALLFVSVAPALARKSAVVFDGAGAAPAPSYASADP